MYAGWQWERLREQEEFFWAGGFGWDWAIWRLMQRGSHMAAMGTAPPSEMGLPRTMWYLCQNVVIGQSF